MVTSGSISKGSRHQCKQVFVQSVRNFCPTLTKIKLCRQISVRTSNKKFHENLSKVSGSFQCGRRDRRTIGRTDIMEIIVAIRNVAESVQNARKVHITSTHVSSCSVFRSTDWHSILYAHCVSDFSLQSFAQNGLSCS